MKSVTIEIEAPDDEADGIAEEVLEYIREMWGEDQVRAKIITT